MSRQHQVSHVLKKVCLALLSPSMLRNQATTLPPTPPLSCYLGATALIYSSPLEVSHSCLLTLTQPPTLSHQLLAISLLGSLLRLSKLLA